MNEFKQLFAFYCVIINNIETLRFIWTFAHFVCELIQFIKQLLLYGLWLGLNLHIFVTKSKPINKELVWGWIVQVH